MKTNYLSILALLFLLLPIGSRAQTIDEIFEEGIRVKKDSDLSLRYAENSSTMSYKLTAQSDKFKMIKDSTLLLLVDRKKEISVVLEPLNPLNYSYSADLTYRIDPTYEASLEFLETFSGTLSDVLDIKGAEGLIATDTKGITDTSMSFDLNPCKGEEIVDGFDILRTMLEDDRLEETKSIYEFMFGMSYKDRITTANDLGKVETRLSAIGDHFDGIEKQIDHLGELVDKYDCEEIPVMNFLVKKVSAVQLHNSREVLAEYRKQLTAQEKLYDLLEKEFKKASAEEDVWGIRLESLSSRHDSIGEYTITIYSSGYELSDSNTVVSVTKKKLLAKTIQVKRFSWLIPEFSVGVAYTSFDYNTYGTTSDSSGQQYIAEPTVNQLRNLKAMAMANFVLYIPQSPVRPVYQLGIGVNADMPTLLTGFGLRTSFSQKAQFTISGGIAMTWLRELNNLKVGDPVSGTSDIENDLKHQFSWPPKPYVGIQYNF